jgi:hypothetical protein
MTVTDDAQALLAYVDAHSIDVAPTRRGWTHMGAIIADAALQRRQRYASTVLPRVRALQAAWPDAATTTGFLARIRAGGDLHAVLSWKGVDRIDQIVAMATVLEHLEIDTSEQLGLALGGEGRAAIRHAFGRVRHVGRKTLDYLDVLTGSEDAVAIDVRVRHVAGKAGIKDLTYAHLASVVRAAAAIRGWAASDLDAALWAHGDAATGQPV